LEKKNEDDSNGDENGEDQSFRQGTLRGFQESVSERPRICYTNFCSGLTTILKHGKKKGNSVLIIGFSRRSSVVEQVIRNH
jgi:hypothetical protein